MSDGLIYSSKKIKDSERCYNVYNCEKSYNIENSNYIYCCNNVENSNFITYGEFIYNSSEIDNCKYIFNSKNVQDSAVLFNAKDVANCYFCDMAGEKPVFNHNIHIGYFRFLKDRIKYDFITPDTCHVFGETLKIDNYLKVCKEIKNLLKEHGEHFYKKKNFWEDFFIITCFANQLLPAEKDFVRKMVIKNIEDK